MSNTNSPKDPDDPSGSEQNKGAVVSESPVEIIEEVDPIKGIFQSLNRISDLVAKHFENRTDEKKQRIVATVDSHKRQQVHEHRVMYIVITAAVAAFMGGIYTLIFSAQPVAASGLISGGLGTMLGLMGGMGGSRTEPFE
ncbi:MAG: hypothetical protein OEV49_08100 [candidate division Zixibacteria bacterium]|nr:hypothetical protein [candidate division Zixibacteria bacterium]MDH3936554.1 hypothetical protein [candidate division Zixibacteria bacterium]MDH4034576.1 hypothetical protein [candidate division Zixibacteria bacterium]